MPTFTDFIDELDSSNIIIDGRDTFIVKAEAAEFWPDVVTDLARTGRKIGISLVRKSSDSPTDHQIDHLLKGYPFTAEQRQMVVNNVVIRS